MKKIVSNIFLASVLLLAGSFVYNCSNEEDEVENISVPIPMSVATTTDITVPLAISDTINEVTSSEIPLNINFDTNIKEEYPTLSLSNLKSAKLSLLTLDYVSSEDSTALSVIKNAKILIKAPNLVEVVMAESTNNTNDSSISFTPVTNLQLLNYFKSGENSIILKVQGRQEDVDDIMKLQLNATYDLEVGL